MVTQTPNFSFNLPAVNDPTDQDLWGGYLNENWTSLDGLLNTGTDLPIGIGTDYWGTTAPTGWLFPYGQAVSRTTYSALFGVLSTTYGAGDGSTTFNLPDKRDRASFGKGDMGGTAANRITNQSGGWEGDTLGASGGAQTHTLTTGEIPSLTGTLQIYISDTTSNPTGSVVGVGQPSKPYSSTNVTFTGGGGAHNNLPPGIVCNYIIYAGV